MIYLASPYTYPDPEVRLKRFQQAMDVTVKFTKDGFHIYSPIMTWHLPAVKHKMPTDFKFWQEHNHKTIDLCDSMWLLCLEGWRKSEGIRDEIDYAKSKHMPTFYVNLVNDDFVLDTVAKG